MPNQKIFNITKYRKNSKDTGAIVTLTYYDQATGSFENVKASVRYASTLAGKSPDEMPASSCMIKDGALWIKVTRLDEFKPALDKQEKKDEETPF